MSQLSTKSLEIQFKSSMSKQKTIEEQEKYFEEEYGSIAKVFVKWRESQVDDFGRHRFPIDNLEKMMKFYNKDKLQPKIGMLLQVFARCGSEEIEVLMADLKKNELSNQAVGNIGKFREIQENNKSVNSLSKP